MEIREMIERLKKVLDKTTPGPWELKFDDNGTISKYGSISIEAPNADPVRETADIGYDASDQDLDEFDIDNDLFMENSRKGGFWWRNQNDPKFIVKAREYMSELITIIEELLDQKDRPYHCPRCMASLDKNCHTAYNGTCKDCGVDLSEYKAHYNKDNNRSPSLGTVIDGLADIIDSGKNIKHAVRWLDKKFLFGAWGHRIGMDHFLIKDLRGIVIAAYKEGHKRGKNTGNTDKKILERAIRSIIEHVKEGL